MSIDNNGSAHQPAGVPNGGQFAAQGRAEGGVTLTEEPRIIATVQFQQWVNDYAVDDGAPIEFDVTDIVNELSPEAAGEVEDYGYRADEIYLEAVKRGRVEACGERPFAVQVEESMNDYYTAIAGPVSVHQHIADVTKEANLGVMAGLIDVIRDRGDLTDEDLRSIDADDVTDAYFSEVAPAIDDIEKVLKAMDEDRTKVKDEPEYSPAEVYAYTRKVCEDAGYGGAMPGVFEVLHDREEISNAQLMALTTDDVNDFYDNEIGPAIDVVTRLLES